MKGILAIALGLTLALSYFALHAQNQKPIENFAAAAEPASAPADAENLTTAADTGTVQDPERITKGPVVSNVTSSSASIAWITEDDAVTEVHYSSDGKRWRSALKPGTQREHVVNVTRLNPNTGYQFRIMTREQAVSTMGAFHTNAQ